MTEERLTDIAMGVILVLTGLAIIISSTLCIQEGGIGPITTTIMVVFSLFFTPACSYVGIGLILHGVE